MPELPEVEVLVRHLRPLILHKTIRAVNVRRAAVLSPTSPGTLKRTLRGAKFSNLFRRGKYLVFELQRRDKAHPLTLVGHLGMTGRMFLAPQRDVLPKHAAVVLDLGRHFFVFEDTRYFGRFTLDTSPLKLLGPEPLSEDFSVAYFANALKRSTQAIKIKLLDQSLVAGVGNIYASEALYRARISPLLAANKLTRAQIIRLRRAIRDTLREAIRLGSTLPLNMGENPNGDGLFYFGSAPGAMDLYEERLRVYDKAGKPCGQCGSLIKRMVQAARSTFYCSRCQRG